MSTKSILNVSALLYVQESAKEFPASNPMFDQGIESDEDVSTGPLPPCTFSRLLLCISLPARRQ